MEGITEQEVDITANTEVTEEFEKFFMNKSELSKLKNEIRGMVYYTLIPSYECTFTEDDVLGELKEMIYINVKEWDKLRYPEFKQFLISNAQNIIKKEVDRLKTKYGLAKSKKREKPGKEKSEESEVESQSISEETNDSSQLNIEEPEENNETQYEEYDEESQVINEKVGENCFSDGVTLYTAKPKNDLYALEHFTENEIDEAVKDLPGKEEKRLFDMRSFTEQNDLSKFEGTVMVILKKEKDSKLLAVFDGKMDGKKKCVTMKECNMSAAEYNNAYRRLLYKLKQELPSQYKSMIVSSILAHLFIRYLYKLNGYLS